MIHKTTFTGYSEDDCFRKINDDITDSSKIISVIPRGHRTFEGYDEYDTWTTYYVDVIYRD